jgi:hypothetical protein
VVAVSFALNAAFSGDKRGRDRRAKAE